MNLADDRLKKFISDFERWKCLPLPGPACDDVISTQSVDTLLRNIASHLLTVAGEAAEGSTKIDWPKIVPENIADLDSALDMLKKLELSAEKAALYHSYISQSRNLYQQIALLPVSFEGHLGFRNETLSAFDFLRTYGFHETHTTPIKVRLESSTLFVELEYSPECPELTFILGTLPEDEESKLFSLDDIFYAAGLGVFFDYSRFDFRSRVAIRSLLVWAAQIVKDHASSVLRDEPNALARLEAKRQERERILSESG